MAIIILTKKYFLWNYFILDIFIFVKAYTIQSSLCLFWEPNREQDFLFILMKSMKISSKSDILLSISQLGVDFEPI